MADLFNKLNQKQANTAKIANVKFVSKLGLADCYIDGIFGTGLNKELDPELCKILKTINKTNALKIVRPPSFFWGIKATRVLSQVHFARLTHIENPGALLFCWS